MSEIHNETPWLCATCGARAYDLEGWGISPDYTLYCERCDTPGVTITITQEEQ